MKKVKISNAAFGLNEKFKNWLMKIRFAIRKEPMIRAQLIDVLRDSQQQNLLDTEALEMIEGVLEVSEMQVREVMIPRPQMVVIQQKVSAEEILPIMIESAHSRFPVIGDSRDEVEGILLAKDLLAHFGVNSGDNIKKRFNIRELLRPAVFIPESKRLNVLLKEFRASRNHMAIVVDEYGGVAGLVTIEDVLEQIVGDIEDEHDIDDDIYIVKHSAVRYTAKAITPIEDFNEQFDADLSNGDFDTMGGLLTHQFGRVPTRGETTTIGRFQFKILRADSRRILLLQLTILEKDQDLSEPPSVDVA
jgi:magnesium and cobalt transporter